MDGSVSTPAPVSSQPPVNESSSESASAKRIAFTVALMVVIVELAAISYIRHRYMDTPLFSAMLQVMLGGTLVFIAGLLIGSS